VGFALRWPFSGGFFATKLIAADTVTEVEELDDWVREGNLVVKDLVKLQGNRLYVTGDLEIQGQTLGFGTIVVGGEIHFGGMNQTRPELPDEDDDDNGTTSQVSSNKLAVYAHKGITLRGKGADVSFFRGLLLSAGKIHAEKISVIGSLVAVGGDTAATRVELSDCLLVQDLLLPANPVMHIMDSEGTDAWEPGRITVQQADKDSLRFSWRDKDDVDHPFHLVLRNPDPAQSEKIEAAGALIDPGNPAPYVESDDRYKSFGGISVEGNQTPWLWILNHVRWIYHQNQSVQEFAPARFYKQNEMLRPAFFRKLP